MKPQAQQTSHEWQNKNLLISSRKLALMIVSSSLVSTLMLSILPSGIFIGLVISAFTGWHFYPQITQFFSLLNAKNASEKPLLHKNPKNNIKYFKQRRWANKQPSPRKALTLTESANTEHETNNVLEFPLKPSSTRKNS